MQQLDDYLTANLVRYIYRNYLCSVAPLLPVLAVCALLLDCLAAKDFWSQSSGYITTDSSKPHHRVRSEIHFRTQTIGAQYLNTTRSRTSVKAEPARDVHKGNRNV
jgi:hypothetical protein